MTTLPSIHEMFPDHLIHTRRGPPGVPPPYAAGPSCVPRLRDAPPPAPRADDMMDVDDADAADADADAAPGKKHVCPTCLKRFNRPSSLRIHVNTHTGATREPILRLYEAPAD